MGQWSADTKNNDPSGITIDPASGDLWVVDRHDAMAYQYAEAASRRDGHQSATASFALDPANHNPEGIADPVASIDFGETVSGSFEAEDEPDQWIFTGTQGQRIFLQVLAGIELFSWTLTDPSDNELFYDIFIHEGAIELPESGQYTLTIWTDAAFGQPYQFQLHNVPAPSVTPITNNEVVNGQIDALGETDLFTFQAEVGQRAYFDAQQDDTSLLTWKLTDPNGAVLFDDWFFDQAAPVFLTAGEYTLTVDPSSDETGAYSFQTTPYPDSVVQQISIGDVVNGDIAVAFRSDLYFFDGVAEQELFFDAQSDATDLYWSLRDPSGQFLFDDFFDDQGPLTLPATGQYALVVEGWGDWTETYQFELVGDSVEPIAIGDVVQGEIAEFGAPDL